MDDLSLCIFQLPAFSLPLIGPNGKGPINSCACVAYSEEKDLLFAGHVDGHISVCNFNKRRQSSAWLAHPNSQVIGLEVSFWMSHDNCLISQGRDGKIKFWNIDSASSPPNFFQEVDCCQFTFCPFDVWPSREVNFQGEKFLAYVGIDDDDASSVNLEVIRSSDGLTVCCVDATQISRLGMCMALSGAPFDGTCRFLGGFEAGCVVLFVEGKQMVRVSPLSPTDTRPVTCLSAFTIDTSITLVAVGRAASPNHDEQPPDFEILKLISEDPANICLERCTKRPRGNGSADSLGISSLTWRGDGRLIIVGQWNGDIRCFAVSPQGNARCLGYLRSPGAVVGGGTLLGDWSSVSTGASKGTSGNQDQSLSVRGAMFLPSKWLITTAPASAGGFGTLNVWDVYRDS